MKGINLLKVKQMPYQKEHANEECNDQYDQQCDDPFKFILIPVGLYDAFFPHVRRQKSDRYIKQ